MSTSPAATSAAQPEDDPPAAALARVVHRTRRAGVAAAGDAEVLARCLAGDLAAGIENALDHRRVDVGHIAVQELRADHHRHAGEADIVLEREAAAGKLAARLALDRRLHVPGAVRILRRRRPIPAAARIFHRRQFIRRCVENGISIGDRRDDLLDGAEIGLARLHAELVRRLAQIRDRRFLKHDQSLRVGSRTHALRHVLSSERQETERQEAE
jgi:hypothetical protein